MDKKSIIGIVIIFAILVVFSIINQPSEEEIDAARIKRDSIAKVEAENALAQQQRQAEQAMENQDVVAMPDVNACSNEDIGKFVEAVVSPIEFNNVEVNENSVVINAGRQSKAALIGRCRQREKELADVLKSFFSISKLRIA